MLYAMVVEKGMGEMKRRREGDKEGNRIKEEKKEEGGKEERRD
jgi:hypothetical protein